jgi:fructoselysine-6-P-deglycase FrlB-like protein
MVGDSYLSLFSLKINIAVFVVSSSEVLTTPEVSKYELNYVTSHKGPSLVAAFSRSGKTTKEHSDLLHPLSSPPPMPLH